MESKDTSVNDRILELRLGRGYSREELAEMAGISSKFLYEIETGRKGFSARTLYGLARALEVSMEYIMTGKEYADSGSFSSEVLSDIEARKKAEILLKIAYNFACGDGYEGEND